MSQTRFFYNSCQAQGKPKSYRNITFWGGKKPISCPLVSAIVSHCTSLQGTIYYLLIVVKNSNGQDIMEKRKKKNVLMLMLFYFLTFGILYTFYFDNQSCTMLLNKTIAGRFDAAV